MRRFARLTHILTGFAGGSWRDVIGRRGGRRMRTRKLRVGVLPVTLLGSALGLGVPPGLAPPRGSGPMPVPSLTDGALGAPAPGTPSQPQQPFPSQQPTAPRPIAPGPVAAPPTNLCQPSVAHD